MKQFPTYTAKRGWPVWAELSSFARRGFFLWCTDCAVKVQVSDAVFSRGKPVFCKRCSPPIPPPTLKPAVIESKPAEPPITRKLGVPLPPRRENLSRGEARRQRLQHKRTHITRGILRRQTKASSSFD